MSRISGTAITMMVAAITIQDGQNARVQSGMDEQALFDLSDSMDKLGQINPVHVNHTGGKYILIAGERRVRAAVQDGSETIHAICHEDLDALTVWRIRKTENSPRYRVNLNVIEEATEYQHGLELGMSVKAMAAEEGISEDTITRRLRLLKLPEEVQRMMVREQFALPIHQALMLVDYDKSKQLELARWAAPVTGPLAGEEMLREHIRQMEGESLPFDSDDPDDENHRKDIDLPRETGLERTAKAGKTGERKTASEKRQEKTERLMVCHAAQIKVTGKMTFDGTSLLKIDGKVEIINADTGEMCEFMDDLTMTVFVKHVGAVKGVFGKPKKSKKDTPSPADGCKKRARPRKEK